MQQIWINIKKTTTECSLNNNINILEHLTNFNKYGNVTKYDKRRSTINIGRKNSWMLTKLKLKKLLFFCFGTNSRSSCRRSCFFCCRCDSCCWPRRPSRKIISTSVFCIRTAPLDQIFILSEKSWRLWNRANGSCTRLRGDYNSQWFGFAKSYCTKKIHFIIEKKKRNKNKQEEK